MFIVLIERHWSYILNIWYYGMGNEILHWPKLSWCGKIIVSHNNGCRSVVVIDHVQCFMNSLIGQETSGQFHFVETKVIMKNIDCVRRYMRSDMKSYMSRIEQCLVMTQILQRDNTKRLS